MHTLTFSAATIDASPCAMDGTKGSFSLVVKIRTFFLSDTLYSLPIYPAYIPI